MKKSKLGRPKKAYHQPELSPSMMLLSDASLAERWDCAESLVARLRASGALPSVLLSGRTVRIPLPAIEEYEKQAATRKLSAPVPVPPRVQAKRDALVKVQSEVTQ
jgi:hypothetical protein